MTRRSRGSDSGLPDSGLPDSGLPEWARRGRSKWAHDGRARPSFAHPIHTGQESVWDYPRPPRLERDTRRVQVRAGSVLLADTTFALRVLETASPPTFYLPPADVDLSRIKAADGGSRCEWKGEAAYWDVLGETGRLPAAGWSYPAPFEEFEALRGFLSFYPARLACTVDGQRVRAQPGRFYGGWVTDELVGPFKGEPGSESW